MKLRELKDNYLSNKRKRNLQIIKINAEIDDFLLL